jgi:hypothetical protein
MRGAQSLLSRATSRLPSDPFRATSMFGHRRLIPSYGSVPVPCRMK